MTVVKKTSLVNGHSDEIRGGVGGRIGVVVVVVVDVVGCLESPAVVLASATVGEEKLDDSCSTAKSVSSG